MPFRRRRHEDGQTTTQKDLLVDNYLGFSSFAAQAASAPRIRIRSAPLPLVILQPVKSKTRLVTSTHQTPVHDPDLQLMPAMLSDQHSPKDSASGSEPHHASRKFRYRGSENRIEHYGRARCQHFRLCPARLKPKPDSGQYHQTQKGNTPEVRRPG